MQKFYSLKDHIWRRLLVAENKINKKFNFLLFYFFVENSVTFLFLILAILPIYWLLYNLNDFILEYSNRKLNIFLCNGSLPIYYFFILTYVTLHYTASTPFYVIKGSLKNYNVFSCFYYSSFKEKMLLVFRILIF